MVNRKPLEIIRKKLKKKKHFGTICVCVARWVALVSVKIKYVVNGNLFNL